MKLPNYLLFGSNEKTKLIIDGDDLSGLTLREKDILKMKCLGTSYAEIGIKYSITGVRVKQIFHKLTEKLYKKGVIIKKSNN